MARLLHEERGLLIASAIRLVLAFGVLALAANEVGQLILTKVRIESAASHAAQAGANVWVQHHDLGASRQAAQQQLQGDEPGASITRIAVTGPDAVTVWARETSATLVVRRISFLRHYGVQTAVQEETPGP